MAKEDETPKYDPEVEKEAIAAEESYKQAHGHYRESSAYNKAQEEESARKAQEEEAEAARKAAKEKRRQDAWRGVRRDLNGEELGEYSMRQDNTRMKDIRPKNAPALTDDEKESLGYVTEGTPEEGYKYSDHDALYAATQNIKALLGQKHGKNTVDIKKRYTLPNGQNKDIKIGEASVPTLADAEKYGFDTDRLNKTGKYKDPDAK